MVVRFFILFCRTMRTGNPSVGIVVLVIFRVLRAGYRVVLIRLVGLCVFGFCGLALRWHKDPEDDIDYNANTISDSQRIPSIPNMLNVLLRKISAANERQKSDLVGGGIPLSHGMWWQW